MNDNGNSREMAHFGYRKVPAHEKVHWVLRHFDTVAGKYDLMNTILSLGIHLVWKRTAVKKMGLKPGDRVIDVCGGTGDLSVLAARDVGPSGRVVLYDINRSMIQAGAHRMIRPSLGDCISFVQGDAEEISFSERCFDAAMVGFGIRNLTYPEKGFQEIYRVLKPGGKLMCLEFSRPISPLFRRVYDWYSFSVMPWLGELIVGSRLAYTYLPESIRMFLLPEALCSLLERVGFTQVAFRRLTNGIAVLHLGVRGGT
ncbi:MAG: bifunctional demethylmenaquinone methyltransferase/2-methoxy-6-polyprenyl-1,4-benzoquinol methylase UbiE [Desulfobacterales bacterium]|nr:MAG: bifunctional demethylmenaquinone methyltransferase/2-methoxy-6-polyprenyl-1,4-benzoquinol methylase UbiE [Desulfobacterales bacterium]